MKFNFTSEILKLFEYSNKFIWIIFNVENVYSA